MDIDDAQHIAHIALTRFGITDIDRIEFVKYRENHVFRAVPADGPSFAVRLHRPGYHDDEEIRTEVDFVRALAERGVPVPTVVPAPDGSSFVHVETNGHRRLVSVQGWVEDAAPFGDIASALDGTHQPDASSFAQIGQLLGALHAASIDIGIPHGFRRPAWDADGLAGPEPLWGDPCALAALTAEQRDEIASATAFVRRRLEALPRSGSTYGVVHADATPENLMETGDGFVLIDFDDFGHGWYAFDLVTALFHHIEHPRYREYHDALVAAYERERPLTLVEREAWDTLLLARGLTYVGWAGQRPGDPASEFVAGAVLPLVLRVARTLRTDAPAPWRFAPGTTTEAHSKESR